MKLFLATAVYATDLVPSQRSNDENQEIARCGSDLYDMTDMTDYEAKCGTDVLPPICAEDETCKMSQDKCHFNCIKKTQCQEDLYNLLLKDGKQLCNCQKKPIFPYSWTCDYIDDKQQHGHASMPPIEKVYSWDERSFTMLEGDRHDEYHSILADKSKYFDNFFQTSPCTGNITINDDNSTSVNFDDLFNNQECMPKCQFDSSGKAERCEVILGYDDLMRQMGDNKLVFRRGTSWELTCVRSLWDQKEGSGIVSEGDFKTIDEEADTETKFKMGIGCCDPDDSDCNDKCIENDDLIPVIQIGPYAEQKNFFVEMSFDYENKAVKDRGFLHIESCTFEEIDANNKTINGPLELIHDGCPTKFDEVQIIDNLRDRSTEYSYREKMDMLPFKIDSMADHFQLTCDLLACPWYAVNDNLCKLKDTCSLDDRYNPLIEYAEDNFEGAFNWISRRRRDTEILPSDTVTTVMKHPCSKVNKESDEYCVDGQGCWTYELCQEQRSSATSAFFATLSALYVMLL